MGGTYVRDFQKTKEKLEETMKDNVRLEKEIAHLNNQIDSTRRLYKSYKEVKGSELVEKMVELEDEKKKLKERADAFELDYSKAFGRKPDYKDMKKEAEENIKKCKEDTEFEKSLKLKLLIENHSITKFAEELELKNDNLIKEYQELSRNHEEEIRVMRMNHENAIKKEKSMIDEATLKVQVLEGDVKKARDWFTGKMKANEKKVEEKER